MNHRGYQFLAVILFAFAVGCIGGLIDELDEKRLELEHAALILREETR